MDVTLTAEIGRTTGSGSSKLGMLVLGMSGAFWDSASHHGHRL